MEYSGVALNQQGSYQKALLKNIESGAGLHYVLMTEDPLLLADTSCSDYYSVAVDTWEEEIISTSVSYTHLIEVSQAVLYTITLAYYPMEGTSSAVQRRLLIDGTVPFEEASQLEFGRVFARESTEDEERQTVLKEEPQWLSATLQDASGFYGPLQ